MTTKGPSYRKESRTAFETLAQKAADAQALFDDSRREAALREARQERQAQYVSDVEFLRSFANNETIQAYVKLGEERLHRNQGNGNWDTPAGLAVEEMLAHLRMAVEAANR